MLLLGLAYYFYTDVLKNLLEPRGTSRKLLHLTTDFTGAYDSFW